MGLSTTFRVSNSNHLGSSIVLSYHCVLMTFYIGKCSLVAWTDDSCCCLRRACPTQLALAATPYSVFSH